LMAWATGILDQPGARDLLAKVERSVENAEDDMGRYPALAVLGPALRMIAEDHEGALVAVDKPMRTRDRWRRATLLMIRGAMRENAGDADAMQAYAAAALAEFRAIG